MDILEKIRYKLSTSIKFVALLSITFQLIGLTFLIFKIYLDVFILFTYLFYLLIIVIGFSRYVEVKSKNFKEKVTNLFWLVNCFPFIIGLIVAVLLNLPIHSEPKEIDSKDVNFIILDKDGNQIEKRGGEMKFNIKNNKIVDSIIQVKTKE